MKSKKPFSAFTDEEVDKYRHQFTKNTLRRASYRWPFRNMAATAARVRRGIYVCATCKKEVSNKEKQLDHVMPVVQIDRGFEGWDVYTERLFAGKEGWAVLCLYCHSIKTATEREQRKQARRK